MHQHDTAGQHDTENLTHVELGGGPLLALAAENTGDDAQRYDAVTKRANAAKRAAELAERATLATIDVPAHVDLIVLTGWEARVLEEQLHWCSGDYYLTAPDRSFVLHLLAEDLHRRQLGQGPPADPDLLALALTALRLRPIAAEAAPIDLPPTPGPEREALCGEVRRDAGEIVARCVELAGHLRAGLDHLWMDRSAWDEPADPAAADGPPPPVIGDTSDADPAELERNYASVIDDLTREAPTRAGHLPIAEWAEIQRARRAIDDAAEVGQ
jgi:hypothetical protein